MRAQMLDLVAVGGGQVGAHAAVVAGDDDAAAARGLIVVDVVAHLQAGGAVGVLQDFGVAVAADGAEKDDRRVREHVLGAAGGVLGGAAGDQFGVAVVQELLVERAVLVLGEDGVIDFEAIFREELVVAVGAIAPSLAGVGDGSRGRISIHTPEPGYREGDSPGRADQTSGQT